MTLTSLLKSIAAQPGGKSRIQRARGMLPKNGHREIPTLLRYAGQIDDVIAADEKEVIFVGRIRCENPEQKDFLIFYNHLSSLIESLELKRDYEGGLSEGEQTTLDFYNRVWGEARKQPLFQETKPETYE